MLQSDYYLLLAIHQTQMFRVYVCIFVQNAVVWVGEVLYQRMEVEHFRKKVYMDTLSSTLIQHTSGLVPQWISQSQINFASAYQFCSYNIQDELTQIIPRGQGEHSVLTVQFRAELNQSSCIIYYIYRQKQNFYLVHLPDSQHQKILIYRNDNQRREYLVYEFLDYLMNEGEQDKSSRSIASRTQKIIEQIRQQEQKQNLKDSVHEMKDVRQLIVVHECGFALVLVEMKKKTGLMLVNMVKSSRQKRGEFFCPIRPANLNVTPPELTLQQSLSSKIIYLFPDCLLSLHRTRDVTRFIILTGRHILLAKISYERMQLSILHKVESKRREKYISAGMVVAGEEEAVAVLCENGRMESSIREMKTRRYMKVYKIEGRRLVEVKEGRDSRNGFKYGFQMEKTTPCLQDQFQEIHSGNVKFNTDVMQSQYQIDQNPDQVGDVGDINRGILMSVFNSVMDEEKTARKNVIKTKQKSLKIITEQEQLFGKELTTSDNRCQDNTIKQIGGFTSNQQLIVIWQKNQSVIHVCKLTSSKEQQQKYNNHNQKKRSSLIRQNKQKQAKQIYNQLMGLNLAQNGSSSAKFQTTITYLHRISLQLLHPKIQQIVISPNSSNLLILSGADPTESKDIISLDVFQLDLFRQIGNQDPTIFFKPIKSIYNPKPTEIIVTSPIREYTLFLTGNLVHSLQNQLLDGVLSFDLHPYNVFLAVSFGLSAKVYAIEGTERLTSLFTMNGQGMKQVKYSPLGNHLCVLFSKCIKIVDSYNFSTKFVINEKNSNFLKCYYSSNGLQFYTQNQSNQFVAYNTFDYSKIEAIKPHTPIADFKPISIKSYLKISQYCFVLQNGSLYVRYKSDAVVVAQEQVFRYADGEKINCVQVDQKNGILFTGCRSGMVRAHIWPSKDDVFDCYSDIRTGFSAVSSISLSNISPFLYVGNNNGNISKLRYMIDRQKGIDTEKEHNLLLSDKNFRYYSMQGLYSVEKMYRFVLQNGGCVSEEMPEKLRLEYKLSEVIQKLNDEMKKLKIDIREQLQQKQKKSAQKVDFGMLHHLHQMITTKLHAQLKEEVQCNLKEMVQLRELNNEQIKKVVDQQSELIKQKSFKISDYIQLRQRLKQQFDGEFQAQIQSNQKKLRQIQHKVINAKKTSECEQDPVYFITNDNIEQCLNQKIRMEKQLQYQNKRHFQLRKQSAYKQTAIKGLSSKKIKEETLQFKIQLQHNEMSKKLAYNTQIIQQFKEKIRQAELKVHKVQAQATVIKNNAQFKRVANIEQMNDACSYKLWVKDKIEGEIADLCDYMWKMQQLLDGKGTEMVELISLKNTRINTIEHLNQTAKQHKSKLKMKKINLLFAHNQLKKVDPLGEFKSLRNSFTDKQQHSTTRYTNRVAGVRTIGSLDRKMGETKSSRMFSVNNKKLKSYNKIMQKQAKFLKSTIKIHQKKQNKLQKQNGQLLFQFQKLKFQQKKLAEQQIINVKSVQKLKNEINSAQLQAMESGHQKPTVKLSKTSFQRYVQLKNTKSAFTSKCKTAASTPYHTSANSNMELNE